jgi:thiamine-phosphate diphosphorylase/hydroxyethylthiazole kinase
MSIQSARQILGPGKIVGATVTSASEARIAVENGADYLGIGTVYATSTKKDTKEIIGINGVRDILQYLDRGSEAEKGVKTVCIGGVNASNLQRILYQTHAPSASSLSPKSLNGVAIVSAIIGASNPQSASSHLAKLIHSPPPFTVASREITVWLNNDDEIRHVLHFVSLSLPPPSLYITNLLTHPHKATLATQKVHSTTPLSHNITNLVVQNFAANIALCIGASPIMSSYGPEAADLANLHGGLVINSGTVTPDMLQNYKQAVAAYNAVGGPVVLDRWVRARRACGEGRWGRF